MNPAVLNYLQSQQMNNSGAQPQGGPQGMQPQQNMGQTPSNPFDIGISKAIESARQSLGLTQKQQDKALRSSMLSFADNISQQPKQRGFFNNFASVGRALSPAIRTHDAEESAGLNENNQLANQILHHQGQEQARQAQTEERDWRRQHAEAQLAEQVRSHNLMDNFRREKSSPQGGLGREEQHQSHSNNDLRNVLNEAEAVISQTGNKGYRNRAERLAGKFLPGGYNNNEEQAAINTLGDVLRGKLFNHWKYRNQAEFKHVPSISAENPPEVNLAIIKKLKGLFAEEGLDEGLGEEMPMQEMSNQESVIMRDANGDQYRIPAAEVEGAMNDGLELVGE